MSISEKPKKVLKKAPKNYTCDDNAHKLIKNTFQNVTIIFFIFIEKT